MHAGRQELATTGVVIAQPPGAGPSDSRKYQSNGSPETDIVYTRGACRDNGTTNPMAGIGVWWRENDPRNIFERCPGDQTNNRAELLAVVRALELTPHSKRVLIVKTDSRYVLNSAGSGIWVQKWRSSDSKTAKRDTVKNQPVIEYLNVLLACSQTAGQDVRLEYVKPHSGNPGSDAADFEAQKGALLPEVPEPNWQALIAGVEPDTPAIEDMPVVDDQSDDLDFLVGGLLTPEALDAELNALEECPLVSVASIAVPLERVNIVGPEALAPELTPSPEVPVLVHRSIKLDKRNPIERTPTQIIIETPSSSSNMIPQSFVSGLSTNSSFRPPERNICRIRHLTIRQIMTETQPPPGEVFEVDKIALVATVLSFRQVSGYNHYELDDGTGHITGQQRGPPRTSDDPPGTDGVTKNVYARVVGKVTRYKERVVVNIDRIQAIGPDFHEIFYHLFSAMVTKVELERARQIRKANPVCGLVMQSQSLHITPSPRQYSTPPRALSFMGSERILNMPLRTLPAPVPIRHPPKLDDDGTEDGEDVDMEDSDDRGDAITINTTSSDGEYMKQDSHQTVVSETESDGVGDYYTPREEPSPCIHAADTILPDADTTFRAPVPRLSTLEHAILLLLQSAQRSGDPYHQARGVHVTAIVRAVKRKIEHPEDMSAALDNLMDCGLITTTIDALHYKAGRLPDHQLSPMLLV